MGLTQRAGTVWCRWKSRLSGSNLGGATAGDESEGIGMAGNVARSGLRVRPRTHHPQAVPAPKRDTQGGRVEIKSHFAHCALVSRDLSLRCGGSSCSTLASRRGVRSGDAQMAGRTARRTVVLASLAGGDWRAWIGGVRSRL